jgi:hypothetical protein
MLGGVGTTAYDGVEPVELRLVGPSTEFLVTTNTALAGPAVRTTRRSPRSTGGWSMATASSS